jgi:hypothetical protein
MNRCRATWVFAGSLLIPVWSTVASGSTPAQEQKAPKSESKRGSSSLSGCVDEQDGHYVLIDDRTLTPIADLEADGFPKEAFAKHLGHKVTVRGTSNSGTSRPLFKVRSVDTIRDTCAPQQQ